MTKEPTVCPFCDGQDIDLEIHVDETYWRCYECGAIWDRSENE